MPLLDLNRMPPGGFAYREPSINWSAPNPYLPIRMVAEQLQVARAQNPASGLDPSFAACLQAVEEFTVKRLGNSPLWCVVQVDMAKQVARERVKRPKCKTCGSGKRRKQT